MKKFKKIMAILVAAVMIMAMMVPAWADTSGRIEDASSNTGTISIGNPIQGQTYYAYPILTLVSFLDVKGSDDDYLKDDHHAGDNYFYAMRADSKWYTFFTNSSYAGDYFTVDYNNPVEIGGVSYYEVKPVPAFTNAKSNGSSGSLDETSDPEWLSNSAAQIVAQRALAYTKSDVQKQKTTVDTATISATYNATYTDADSLTDGKLVLANNAQLGYYLVDSTLGSLCSLDTTNNNVVIKEKNYFPSLDKEVKEDSNASYSTTAPTVGGFQDVNDVTVGQKVYYRSIITVQKGAVGYQFVDAMDDGLTFDSGSLKVYYIPTGVSEDTASNWTEIKSGNSVKIGAVAYKNGADFDKADYYLDTVNDTVSALGTGSEFEIKFTDEFLAYISNGITDHASQNYRLGITYEATLNEKAPVGTAIKNVCSLYYGDNSALQTAEYETDTYTWGFQVYKYTGDLGATHTSVGGAVFAISDSDATTLTSYNGSNPSAGYNFVELASGDEGYDSSLAAASIPQYKVVPFGSTITISGSTKTVTGDWGNGSATKNVLSQITTNPTSGKFVILGLDSGEYYAHEITAPDGYYKLTHPEKIVIDSGITASTQDTDGAQSATVKYGNYAWQGTSYPADASLTAASTTDGFVAILNETSTELPSTGGMGTTVLYIVGGMLVILAGAYLFFSRRRNAA